ncbi:MAG: hypothetical protein KGJ51_01985 [Acidobacteriota bacterium]|nr:hypothetical protein [Acidobacteriota bacterium]
MAAIVRLLPGERLWRRRQLDAARGRNRRPDSGLEQSREWCGHHCKPFRQQWGIQRNDYTQPDLQVWDHGDIDGGELSGHEQVFILVRMFIIERIDLHSNLEC